jgi:hypothetical protein
MLGTWALAQDRALGSFLEPSSGGEEESLDDSDESRTPTTYARFDGPKDLHRFLDNDDLLGGPTLTPTTTSTHPKSASCVMETLPPGIPRHPMSTLPSTL